MRRTSLSWAAPSVETEMKTIGGNSLAALAIVGIAFPVQAFAEVETTNVALSVTDVALSTTGELYGKVIQSSGRPVSNAAVQVSHDGATIAEVKTDNKGRYAVKGLRSGVHVVKTSQSQHVCRFWSDQSAPSTAKKSLVMSVDSHVVRGQLMAGGVGSPLGATVVGGTTAAVIWTTVGQSNFYTDGTDAGSLSGGALGTSAGSSVSSPASP